MVHGEERSSDSGRARTTRLIKGCALFERATRATRDEVVRAASYESVPSGAVILEQGSQGRGLLVIGRGRARVERSGRGGRIVALGYRATGDILVEPVLDPDDWSRIRVVAIAESEILRVDSNAARRLLSRDAGLATAVLEAVHAQKREIEERLESILFRNVEERLAEFLLQAADRWGVEHPDGRLISAPLTHLEIAQGIGSTRETVTLTLGALRREGLILAVGRKLCIVDRAALAERAR